MRHILKINNYTERMTPEPRDSTSSKNLKADTCSWERVLTKVSNRLDPLCWLRTFRCAESLVGAVPNTGKE